AAAACVLIAWWWSNSHTVARGDGVALAVGADIPPAVRDVRFSDHSLVVIAPSSHVRLGGDAQHKRLDLTDGSVEAHVAPQTGATSFTIATPHGEATVLGTRFRVDVEDDCSVVSVSEGRVALRSGEHAQSATAGQRMVAANGTVVLAPPPWNDHRPLGCVVLSGMMGPPGHQPASNPSGWLFDPAIDLQPAAFSARMTDAIDQAIAGLRRADAQGVLLYGIEGGVHQQDIGFPGDPRRLAEFAPEFDAIADALFARIRTAGFRVGVTISPWRFERRGTTWHKDVEQADNASAEAELDSRIVYARKRWDCTVFFINTAGPGIPTHIRVPAAALRAVALRHPDVLLIVENATIAHTAVAAGQALSDQAVPPGRTVVRLPWFGANPTPAVLAAAKAAGDVLVFDPLNATKVEALHALIQPSSP
ncbi:MAG: FecR domain-containing protein, partial [Planctomycetes bacterium]|nr:FecR domain-containing protein [Planctomycetota bacterium]